MPCFWSTIIFKVLYFFHNSVAKLKIDEENNATKIRIMLSHLHSFAKGLINWSQLRLVCFYTSLPLIVVPMAPWINQWRICIVSLTLIYRSQFDTSCLSHEFCSGSENVDKIMFFCCWGSIGVSVISRVCDSHHKLIVLWLSVLFAFTCFFFTCLTMKSTHCVMKSSWPLHKPWFGHPTISTVLQTWLQKWKIGSSSLAKFAFVIYTQLFREDRVPSECFKRITKK